MGDVIRFHGRASVDSKPNKTGSARLLSFAKASLKIRNLSGGMLPRVFQLLTADGPTPERDATAVLPPKTATSSSMVVSMVGEYSSRPVNLSTLHGVAVDLAEGCGDNLSMPPAGKTLGKRLKMTREALGVSAADLCRRIDCKPNRWSQYENGERPITLPIAIRLCDVYGLTLDWIYRADPSGLPVRLHQKLSVTWVA
jgi:DNA-binding XRE family transcriptional regulator